MAGPVPAFLIVGTPRSGTTLVQRLACELPGVRVPPETHFWSLFAPPLLTSGRFPLEGDELRRELERFCGLSTSRGMTLNPGALAEELGSAGPLDLYGAIVRDLAGLGEVYGEKTGNHLLWWRPLTRALPGLKLVAVVRDPRAVVASYQKTWGSSSTGVLAERWCADQRQVLRAARRIGRERLLVVRYEDVVADPDTSRTRLARFLGVPPPASRPVPLPSRALFLDWESWKKDATGAIRGDRAEAWRDVLSLGERTLVERIARKQMREFGYSDGLGSRLPSTLSLSPSSCLRQRFRFRWRRGIKVLRNRLLGLRIPGQRARPRLVFPASRRSPVGSPIPGGSAFR